MAKLDTAVNIVSFTLASLMAVSILFFPRFLPERLPLFYSLPWGEEQLASNLQFQIIPAIIILILLINLVIKKQLHPSQSFLKIALSLTSLAVTLILTITFIKIVLIFI